MTCGEFLARHSEYLDEEMTADAAVEMRLHLAGCARCARYDRVLRRGLTLLRDTEPVQPARDPLESFRTRLATVPPAREEAAPRVPIAATVAVAGVVALVAWSALFRLAGVPGTATGEPVRGSAVSGPAEVGSTRITGARPVVRGMDLVGAGRPVRPASLPGAGEPERGSGFQRLGLEGASRWAGAPEP
ncbi:MAG TPA: zf-HC2 domain-containing protein, partial [Longimicrobiales bacterium]